MSLVPTLRQLAVRAADTPPARALVRLVAGWDRGRRDRLAILTYHRVDVPDDDLYPGLISASPEAFDRQVAWLANAYHPVSLAEVLARRDGGPALPRRSVLITFDDAYRCFGDHAWPILRRHGVPATVFVPTAYPGDPGRRFWWDRLHRALVHAASTGPFDSALGPIRLGTPDERAATFKRLRAAVKSMPHDAAMAAVDQLVTTLDAASDGGADARPPVLDWDRLRALQADGAEIGSHTRTHPLLDRLDPACLDGEIAGARTDLERELGGPFTTIAYPNGNVSPAVRDAAERAELRLGFTTRRGTNDLRAPDWFELRRINVSPAAGEAALTGQLHGWLDRWT